MAETLKIAHKHSIDLTEYVSKGLTPEKVWQGYVQFIKEPARFVDSLERAEVTEIPGTGGQMLARVLDYGSFKARDRVIFEEMSAIHCDCEASESYPRSMLSIEFDFSNGRVSIDFTYRGNFGDRLAANPKMAGILHQAWEVKDHAVTGAIVRNIINAWN